jgi:hypothetical protein
MSRKRFFEGAVIIVLLFAFSVTQAKADAAMWTHTYGGANYDVGESVVETSDGGYAIAGYTASYGTGSDDVWLVKTDANGSAQWNQTYGGINFDDGYSLVETSDGGYAIAGCTSSFGAGDWDFWLVKTNASGNMEWNQTYGGINSDWGCSVVEVSDGGYAIAGSTNSYGAGNNDFWLVKTDSSGVAQWNQTYGGTHIDSGCSMVEVSDGGYAIAGSTNSYGAGGSDVWLIKTNSSGVAQWNQTYGGGDDDYGYSVVETSDGGYAIAGSLSYGAGAYDVWLVKTNTAGVAQWNQTYDGASGDCGYSVVETIDGGYAIAGSTISFGAGSVDVWLVKTDELGIVPEAPWVALPLMLIATLAIFISRKKLLHPRS